MAGPEDLISPSVGSDAREKPKTVTQSCKNESQVPIYIAITIDDGPRPVETDKFIKFLDAEGVPATWYVVRSNIEEMGDSHYTTLQTLTASGHEIAIHEALPKSEVDSAVSKAGRGTDKTEHVPPIPSHRFYHYKDVDTWVKHVKEFKEILDKNGTPPRFYRPPGGLLTEFSDLLAKNGLSGKSSDLVDWLNDNYLDGPVPTSDPTLLGPLQPEPDFTEPEAALPPLLSAEEQRNLAQQGQRKLALKKVIGSKNLDETYEILDSFVTGLGSSDLKLWGGNKILGSNKRDQANERQIALRHFSLQSWTAEVAPSRDNLESKIRSRFRRRNSDGSINETVSPFVVVLTHDNKGYFSGFSKTIRKVKTMPEVTGEDAKFCLQFVTMSELYDIVGSDAPNAGGQ